MSGQVERREPVYEPPADQRDVLRVPALDRAILQPLLDRQHDTIEAGLLRALPPAADS